MASESHYRGRNGRWIRKESYSISDAQKQYLRRLLSEALAHLYQGIGHYPEHVISDMTKAEASTLISRLIQAKQDGWK